MSKKSPARRKPRTHFEQVPVDVVKHLRGVEADKAQGATNQNLIVEPAAGKTEPYSLVARTVTGAPFKLKLAERPR
jgi:hypothetical protein